MALGRLTIHPTNPRYFADGTGKAVLLVGSHNWFTSQDYDDASPPAEFDFDAYLDMLAANGHNFIRGWLQESPKWTTEPPGFAGMFAGVNYVNPMPYERTGPGNAADGGLKFDLTAFNQDYFDRIRARAVAANARGIYYSAMLFNGWSLQSTDRAPISDPWANHPFKSTNNVNSINGDPAAANHGYDTHTLGIPAITALQEAYIEKMVDTLNDLDNTIYEVSNESADTSEAWHNHIIDHIKAYELTKPKQHLVIFSVYLQAGSDSELSASDADIIAPRTGYTDDMTVATGSKVVLADTDHVFGIGGTRAWAWKNFMRGNHPLFMDPYTETTSAFTSLRANLGYIRTFSERVDLKSMAPQNSLATAGYCLAKAAPTGEYLAYQPGTGAFDVNLTATPGGIRVEWFNPATGVTTVASDVTGGSTRTFTPPFAGDAVLYLRSSTTPTIYPDIRRSVDFMKKMKDTVENQLTTAEKTKLAELAAESYCNYGAFSVPLATQAEFVAAGSAPLPRTIEGEWLDWCDVMHGEGLGIIFRPAFPGMESDDSVNGLYGFQWKVGANRIPAGTYDSVINQGQYDSWCGKAYLFIKNNPDCFNDLGPNPDVFAFAPERNNSHIFNDATSFLPHTSPGIQANYVEFYRQLNMVCQKAFEEIGKPGIIMHDTANNYSGPRTGWVWQTFFDNAQRISVDYYLNHNGSGFSAQAAVDDMLWLYDNRGHHRLCWQEYGPIQTAALPMAERAADFQAWCDEVYERLVLPGKIEEINFWVWWDGQNTSFLNKTGSGASAVYTLNEMGGVMKQFYKDIYDQLVESEPEPEPPPAPSPPPSRGRMSARRRKLILASLN